jgi:tripartite-type tricarboxylate transporter receptor subunit TctC
MLQSDSIAVTPCRAGKPRPDVDPAIIPIGNARMPVNRLLALMLLSLEVLPFALSPACAQDYPSRTIRIVVPFAPGGAVDVIARIMAKNLTERLHQPVYVENRAGASGNVGAEAVAEAAPDGYTLLFSASTFVVNPIVLAEHSPFDPIADFTPLALIAKGPLLFIVHPSTADSVQDFVARARAHPEAFNFATGGYGSAGHMAAESLKLRAELNIPVVLYKGTGPAFTDIISGTISGMLDPIVTSLPLVKGKKVAALALAGPTRSPLAPDVPTFAEAGFPSFEFYTWYGLWAPAHLPTDVADTISRALTVIGSSAETRQWFESEGLQYSGVGGTTFIEFEHSEQKLYADIVKNGHIKPQ